VTTLQTCRPRINHFPFLLRQRRYLVHKRLLEARQVSKIQQVAGATGDNRKQRELFAVQFQGLIVIHTADEIERLQAGVYGANLHDTLVSPILSSLRSFFPTAEHSVVDSSWSLTVDASLKQRPFELTLRIRSSGWQTLYSIGLRIALHTAVDRYRSYLAQANNI